MNKLQRIVASILAKPKKGSKNSTDVTECYGYTVPAIQSLAMAPIKTSLRTTGDP